MPRLGSHRCLTLLILTPPSSADYTNSHGKQGTVPSAPVSVSAPAKPRAVGSLIWECPFVGTLCSSLWTGGASFRLFRHSGKPAQTLSTSPHFYPKFYPLLPPPERPTLSGQEITSLMHTLIEKWDCVQGLLPTPKMHPK